MSRSGAKLASGGQDVAEHRPAAHLVEHLRRGGPHPGALARRQDDDGGWPADGIGLKSLGSAPSSQVRPVGVSAVLLARHGRRRCCGWEAVLLEWRCTGRSAGQTSPSRHGQDTGRLPTFGQAGWPFARCCGACPRSCHKPGRAAGPPAAMRSASLRPGHNPHPHPPPSPAKGTLPNLSV